MLRRLYSLVLPLAGAALLAGCSGTTPAASPVPAEPVPAGPAYDVVALTEEGLARIALPSGERTVFVEGAGDVLARAVSPSGDRTALAYTRNDSSFVAVVDAEAVLTPGFSVPGRRTFTLAWRSDGEAFAAGYYTPEGTAMGAGGIMAVDAATGAARTVGCSASKMVYRWPDTERMLVGDGKNIYLVDAGGCATRSTTPILKKHMVAVSPDGRRMAYIFRDLVYDREARAYEPDSTLMVANVDGSDERTVAGKRYHPKNLAWSPDGQQLAFDVTSQTNPALRHLAIYDMAAGEATFIVRATDTVLPSETRPAWSPDGAFLVFDRTYVNGDLYQKGMRSMVDNAVYTLAEQPRSGGKLAIWGWAGPRVVLETPDGRYLVAAAGTSRPDTLVMSGRLVALK